MTIDELNELRVARIAIIREHVDQKRPAFGRISGRRGARRAVVREKANQQGVFTVYRSLTDAALNSGRPHQNIRRSCTDGFLCGGARWRFLQDMLDAGEGEIVEMDGRLWFSPTAQLLAA